MSERRMLLTHYCISFSTSCLHNPGKIVRKWRMVQKRAERIYSNRIFHRILQINLVWYNIVFYGLDIKPRFKFWIVTVKLLLVYTEKLYCSKATLTTEKTMTKNRLLNNHLHYCILSVQILDNKEMYIGITDREKPMLSMFQVGAVLLPA